MAEKIFNTSDLKKNENFNEKNMSMFNLNSS